MVMNTLLLQLHAKQWAYWRMTVSGSRPSRKLVYSRRAVLCGPYLLLHYYTVLLLIPRHFGSSSRIQFATIWPGSFLILKAGQRVQHSVLYRCGIMACI